MLARCTLWLLLAVATAGAGRDDPPTLDPAVVAAEHQRLSEELERLVERQVWAGAENKFKACEALGVPLTFQDLLHGAYAARGLGDARAAYVRLKAAATLQASREVVDWLWALDTGYGQVVLTTNPVKGVELQVEAMPFAPDQRAAVEHAMARLREEGRFEGLLPLGRYVLGDLPFSVEPGVSVQLEVSTRKPRGRDPRPAPAEPAPATPEPATPAGIP